MEILKLAVLALGAIAYFAQVSVGTQQAVVELVPGQDIQASINSLPAGTVFLLKAGLHRLSSPLTPRDDDTFVGELGTVVSGARVLTTLGRSGALWYADGQTQQGQVAGQCEAGYPRCSYPEDLFIDDKLLQAVGTFADVAPGKWYFDYAADRIYFADDPIGRRVETSVVRSAFSGGARNVTIGTMTIEKFATPAQVGAIHGDATTSWIVQDNEIRWNHAVGVRSGPGMQLLRNNVHHNGQEGMGGLGDNVVVEANEIAYNNTCHFNPGWEAGGTKFVKTQYLIVRGNYAHHNAGPGLWTDIDNIYTTIEDNTVEYNAQMGIFHEISYDAVIRHNTARQNGWSSDTWLWGAGILVAASVNVEISGNMVSDNANGIGAVQQNRGSGAYGPHEISNLWVHDNTVTMTSGRTGLAEDVDDRTYFTSRNNHFVGNTYYLGTSTYPFEWMDSQIGETRWRQYGEDVNGIFNR